MTAITAVVFDFDGVIANSEPLHYRAFRDVLRGESVALPEQDYYARYLGFDDAGTFRAVGQEHGLAWGADHIAELVERKAVRMEEIEHGQSVLFPGAESAIRRLAAHLPLAIASGALRGEIERVLLRTDLARYFGAVVGAEDTPMSKPAPDPYLRAVSLLGSAIGRPLRPAECVAVEDSRWGLESARQAGLRTIAVTHTYPAAELGGADLVIANLDALDLAELGRISAS
jgi:HAD superfamily hydrolase (TIGR01509 family)